MPRKKFKEILRLGLISFVIFYSISVFAQPVSEQEARRVVGHWIKHLRGKGEIEIKGVEEIWYEGLKLGYVFSLNPNGYVFVPNEDLLPPIRAYSFTHGYNTHGSIWEIYLEKEIYELINWVRGDAFAISTGEKNRQLWEYLSQEREDGWFTISQGPLLQTTWDQEWPYNAYTPLCSSGPHGHCPTGCGPTALAQIMHYWQWPPQGRGSHSYFCFSVGQTLSANFEHPYYWELMPNYLTASSPEDEIDAVARLMADIGIGAEAEYDPEGTASDIPNLEEASFAYFRYNLPQFVFRRDYPSDDDWFDELKEEIDEGRPVLLSLKGEEENNHAVVLDGYRIDYGLNQVHLNFGWSGYADEWYVLNNIEGSDFEFNDVLGQQAGLNIKPDTEIDSWVYYDALNQGGCGYDNSNKGYGIVRFDFDNASQVNMISFYIVYPNTQFEVRVYKGFEGRILNEIILLRQGVSTRTGWYNLKLDSPIFVSAGDRLYVCVKFVAPVGKTCPIPIDWDGNGTGRSFVDFDIFDAYPASPMPDHDINIRLGTNLTSVGEYPTLNLQLIDLGASSGTVFDFGPLMSPGTTPYIFLQATSSATSAVDIYVKVTYPDGRTAWLYEEDGAMIYHDPTITPNPEYSSQVFSEGTVLPILTWWFNPAYKDLTNAGTGGYELPDGTYTWTIYLLAAGTSISSPADVEANVCVSASVSVTLTTDRP
ncbi:MAG: hypothetical protein DRP81_03545 [Candidatus Omnitrophota bacterium]|nr:MAG: hypothetical protein DRP81_03545 [Candidatus Omnitrophota bacterium]